MRCGKHPADLSSAGGVCASCLRERLVAVIAAQMQHSQSQLIQYLDGGRESDTVKPLPPAFPASVSPYISRRKSDTNSACRLYDRHERRFYSTPQVGPTGSVSAEIKKSGGRFVSLLSGLFRSKSENLGSDLGPDFDRGDPCTSSPSRFSSTVTDRRKQQAQAFSLNIPPTGEKRRNRRDQGRGMSPARLSDDEDGEHFRGGSSGYSSESSQGWRQTPMKKTAHKKNTSGLNFCLSPLVRARPSTHQNQKSVQTEELALGKNRSRKLADFGRSNANYS